MRVTLLTTALLLTGCGVSTDELDGNPDTFATASQALINATVPIVPDLNTNSPNSLGELSGLVASPNYPGFIWAHRDGYAPDRPSRERVYAMKVVNRKLVSFNGAVGTYPTREFTFAAGLNIANNNWEDIALGNDLTDNTGLSLYIGDIGNNTGGRNLYQVYQIAQPDPAGASSVIAALQATWKFAYPASAQLANGDYPNCETMFYLDRNLYIVTKESSPRVYRFPNGFFSNPAATYTLVPVVNGSTTHLVGGGSNPSYGSFSADHQRFAIGSHTHFFVYTLAANTLVGDALVKAMLLTPGHAPAYDHDVSNLTTYPKLNTEGGTYAYGTRDLVLGTEGRLVFHWPQANIESK